MEPKKIWSTELYKKLFVGVILQVLFFVFFYVAYHILH